MEADKGLRACSQSAKVPRAPRAAQAGGRAARWAGGGRVTSRRSGGRSSLSALGPHQLSWGWLAPAAARLQVCGLPERGCRSAGPQTLTHTDRSSLRHQDAHHHD